MTTGRKALRVFAVMGLVWAIGTSGSSGGVMAQSPGETTYLDVLVVMADSTFSDALSTYTADTAAAEATVNVILAADDFRVKLAELKPWPECTSEWLEKQDEFLSTLIEAISQFATDQTDEAVVNASKASDLATEANDLQTQASLTCV